MVQVCLRNTQATLFSNFVTMTHKIIPGDTLQELRKLRDGSIDFICADFPYNISGKGGMTMKGNNLVAADF